MNKHELHDYEELAAAIIRMAAEDYKQAYRNRNSRWKSTREQARSDLIRLEMFFRGDWYAILTDLDGEYLMERLREEVDR